MKRNIILTLWLFTITSAFASAAKKTALAEYIPEEAPPSYATPIPGTQKRHPWWSEFGGPELVKLIDDALRGNWDVKAANQRVLEAEAVARRNMAPLFPSFSFDISANITPMNSLGFQFGSMGSPSTDTGQPVDLPDLFYSGSALFKVSLQADIWGRHYLNYRASKWDTIASTNDRDGQAVRLASLIAEVYFDTIVSKSRVALLKSQLEINETLLSLMQKRFELGQVNALDVLQQRQQVAATRALIPKAQTLVETGLQQLKVLRGDNSSKRLELSTREPPELPNQPPTGLPKDLIRNLPELRAASARIQAAEKRADSAFRALLPRLLLSGDIGYQARYIDEMADQETWGAGAVISIPLWEGGSNHAALDQANAQKRFTRYTLTQSFLQAVTEVESAVTQEMFQQEHLKAVKVQLEAAQIAFTEAKQRYLAGLDSYLNVLTALNIHQQAQLSTLQSQRDLIMSRLRLYKSLGGPWTKGLAKKNKE